MSAVDEPLLRSTWRRVAGQSSAADSLYEQVVARYREPHRRYHTLAHLTAVIRHVETLLRSCPAVADADAVRAAAFFHDAVYDPQSPTNEHDSADLALDRLCHLGWSELRASHVAHLVRSTAHLEGAGGPADDAARTPCTDVDVLLDADLAVLGAGPAVYRAYATGVRAEYVHLDDAAWRTGRAAVLRSLLAMDPLYRTPTMRAEREHRARANLTAELSALDGPR